MAKLAIDIRSVLIPVAGKQMLLPNATVAEVITYVNPDPFDSVPEWVLGRVTWRGWRVPVISLGALAGWTGEESRSGAKIAVLKGLGGHSEMPFMALLTRGFPRLVTVTADSLESISGDESAEADSPAEPAPAPAPETPDDGDFEVRMDFAELENLAGPSAGESASMAEADDDVGAERDEAVDASAAVNGSFDLPEDFVPVKALVRVNGERALIPDLLAIEKLIADTVGRDALRSRG